MIASHGGLDDTGAIVVAAAGERQSSMARMCVERRGGIGSADWRPRRATCVPGNRIANHRPKLVVSHRS
jgi:hypothetical protein